MIEVPLYPRTDAGVWVQVRGDAGATKRVRSLGGLGAHWSH